MTKQAKTKTVKAKSTVKADMQAKKAVFLAALVAAYGEGAAITRKQMVAVYNTNKEAFPHFGMIKRDANYKLGRNQFVVTTSADPASVRDKTMANMTKLQAKKESVMLPKETRKSAKKLLAAVTSPAVKATKPSKFAEPDTMEGFEVEEDNINDILRTL